MIAAAKQFYRQFDRKNKYQLLFLSLLTITIIILNLTIPIYMGKIIDNIVKYQYKNVKYYLLILFIITVTYNLFEYFKKLSSFYINFSLSKNIQVSKFSKIIDYPPHIIEKYNSSYLSSRIREDSYKYSGLMINTFMIFLDSSLLLIFGISAIVLLNYKLAILSILCFPLFGLVQLIYTKKIRSLASEGFEKKSQEYRFINESLRLNKSIKSHLLQNYEIDKVKKAINNYQLIAKKYFKNVFQLDNLSSFFISLTSLAILALGGYFVSIDALSVGELVAFISIVHLFSNPLSKLFNINKDLQNIYALKERIDQIHLLCMSSSDNSEVSDNNDKLLISRINKGLSFQNVRFKYDDTWIINNLNISFNQKGLIALMGDNGSGKSTLLHLIVRFIEPNNGVIYYNGESILNYNIFDLRNKIVLISGSDELFTQSIKHNIILDLKDVSDKEIINIAEQLNYSKIIETLPNGLETTLIENGNNLSNGEKQKIILSRIFFKKEANVILLDEPTSSVDKASLSQINNKLKELSHEKLVIIATHDESIMPIADQIYMFKKRNISQIKYCDRSNT